MPDDVLHLTDAGLYCPAGDFYIDPWQPVARAVITHAHSDHARPGSAAYLATREGERVLRTRLGVEAHIETLTYGEAFRSMASMSRSIPPVIFWGRRRCVWRIAAKCGW